MRTALLCGILLYAYPVGFLAGSFLLRKLLLFINSENRKNIGGTGINLRNIGFWIGACEHFIIVTFILLGQYTVLGILVAARGILRAEDIKGGATSNEMPGNDRASYFLIGMLLSISFATFFALTSKGVLLLLKFKIPPL